MPDLVRYYRMSHGLLMLLIVAKPVRAATTQVTNTASIVMLLQAFSNQATSDMTIPAIAGEPLHQWMETHAALTKADG